MPTFRYEPLPSRSSDGLESEQRALAPRSKLQKALSRDDIRFWILLCLLLATSFLSHEFGRRSCSTCKEIRTSQALSLNTLTQNFRYNRTFSMAPDEVTNRAWQEIFPSGGGFFSNPAVAPRRSTFTVFHQLHCLDSIRRAYWSKHDMESSGETRGRDEVPTDDHQPHVRHCIDLIRQSLICAADTTLEVVDEKIRGVKGFGTTHTCRDWRQLVRWVEEQQAREA